MWNAVWKDHKFQDISLIPLYLVKQNKLFISLKLEQSRNVISYNGKQVETSETLQTINFNSYHWFLCIFETEQTLNIINTQAIQAFKMKLYFSEKNVIRIERPFNAFTTKMTFTLKPCDLFNNSFLTMNEEKVNLFTLNDSISNSSYKC